MNLLMPACDEVDIGLIHRETEKRNHFSFVDKSFNTQCNLTKLGAHIVSEYDH